MAAQAFFYVIIPTEDPYNPSILDLDAPRNPILDALIKAGLLGIDPKKFGDFDAIIAEFQSAGLSIETRMRRQHFGIGETRIVLCDSARKFTGSDDAKKWIARFHNVN